MRYKAPFLNVVQFAWKLQFDHVIFFGFSQACPKCYKKKLVIHILKKDLIHQCGFLVLNDTPPLRIFKNRMAVKNLVLKF